MGLQLSKLVENVHLLIVVSLDYFLTGLTQLRAPENETFHFFVTKPAMFLLLSHHLPLTRTWNLIFVLQVAHKN